MPLLMTLLQELPPSLISNASNHTLKPFGNAHLRIRKFSEEEINEVTGQQPCPSLVQHPAVHASSPP